MDFFGLDDFLRNALREDIGTGDITTNCCVPAENRARGLYRAKEDGVVCGTFILQRVFDLLGGEAQVTVLLPDGSPVEKGQIIAEVAGPARTVLTGERVGLNILQHLSGIATGTAKAAAQVAGTRARVADTRKTTPGMRELEKYAVRIGGGSNHRFNLSDGVLIKDNHIVAAGGIGAAVDMVRKNIPHTLKIEVETENMDQIRQALDAGADIIMLDNMSLEQMTEAVKFIDGRALTEASGNMGEKDLRAVAECGVDIISIGALTHTVKPLDISLKFVD